MDQAVEISLVEVPSPDLWPSDHTHHTRPGSGISWTEWDQAALMWCSLPPVSDDDELGRLKVTNVLLDNGPQSKLASCDTDGAVSDIYFDG